MRKDLSHRVNTSQLADEMMREACTTPDPRTPARFDGERHIASRYMDEGFADTRWADFNREVAT